MYTNHFDTNIFETAVSIGSCDRSYLINNIFTNSVDAIVQTISRILLKDITDYKAIFTSANDVQYK